MNWLRVTVLTTTQGSEIVSQALIDAGSAGTMIEDRNDVRLNQRPEGQWDILGEDVMRRMSEDVRVTGYYPLDERAPGALEYVNERVRALNKLAPDIDFGKLEVLTGDIDDEDWAESWKSQYKPFRLGAHIVVKPDWEKYELEPEDKLIVIDPGMAFGTGTHETTGMCVCLVEEYSKPGMSAVDVGTGTGILAITAALCGAGRVTALDLDIMAVRVARENVNKNGLSHVIDVHEGDLISGVTGRYDMVVANIIADVIIKLAVPARELINPGGVFICSGIAREREDEAILALRRAGYGALDIRRQGEWTAIACARD